MFSYQAEPLVLQSLSKGQLANRFMRSVRFWYILRIIYDNKQQLIKEFSYEKIRDRLYAPEHPTTELSGTKNLNKKCTYGDCLCHQTTEELIFADNNQELKTWRKQIKEITGFSDIQLDECLKNYPFATVHRSLREDLRQLAEQGWILRSSRGKYKTLTENKLPTLPITEKTFEGTLSLSKDFGWSVLHILDTIAFIQPNLASVTQQLWEQLNQAQGQHLKETEPQQRIFIHLDYILSQEKKDQVDNYQEQLEQLWNSEKGVIKFTYCLAMQEKQVEIITYPVCLHYMRRAKYLSAYGLDLEGKINWHNYRLDRIISKKLEILPWQDAQVPTQLKQMRERENLPTPPEVQKELDQAWGFNFYLPKELLIMRFPVDFAQWYVNETVRHESFRAIAYQEIPKLLNKEKLLPQEKEIILKIIKQRSPEDAYYSGWVRSGDINVLMRLRDWRPKGEVIAPFSYRKILAQEAAAELANYS